MTELELSALRRSPDVEADNLFAWDSADEYLLDASRQTVKDSQPGTIAVIGDNYGAITLSVVLGGHSPLRVHQDALSGELALAKNARILSVPSTYSQHRPGPELLSGAKLVLMRLPRSLSALEELCWKIARYAHQEVVVMAAGRVKHMTPAMNDVLGRYFDTVHASLARRKSRILTASDPRLAGECPFPVSESHDVGMRKPLVLSSHGAAFGGGRLDLGTRFLLPQLQQLSQVSTAVDLGCGTGAIAAYLALQRPDISVIAVDHSAAAVDSALLTMRANGVDGQVKVVRDDGLSSLPDASQEVIILNPPFHMGATVHSGIALKLFREASRALSPGGQLWTVWNTHLGYLRALSSIVGPTRQVDRNPRFTVTVSTRRL
ncbi:class I SAM-dependent methyltransferase [Arthrobacter roseus]|uniref:class I SAM-dependent methyltransferase n=1 Tax=Arthrobacter roseus TaxID=136274 RepID=UPI0019658075|nr:methyltransferase [Arthrobacter roseus]MBM7848459.1 16S rRNA (guanine1207-N2)-methyltransferase [Arthrobacter roseus]